MIRTTIATLILTAATVITVGTAAPVFAAAPSDGPVATIEAEHASAPATSPVGSSWGSSRIDIERPTISIGEDADQIMDMAMRGASILTLDRMMIAFVVVLVLIAMFGITSVVLVASAVRRATR